MLLYAMILPGSAAQNTTFLEYKSWAGKRLCIGGTDRAMESRRRPSALFPSPQPAAPRPRRPGGGEHTRASVNTPRPRPGIWGGRRSRGEQGMCLGASSEPSAGLFALVSEAETERVRTGREPRRIVRFLCNLDSYSFM